MAGYKKHFPQSSEIQARRFHYSQVNVLHGAGRDNWHGPFPIPAAAYTKSGGDGASVIAPALRDTSAIGILQLLPNWLIRSANKNLFYGSEPVVGLNRIYEGLPH
ncbi:MAG TPA: hypothetical protein VMF50_14675 [Candidatus Binataceae bacterium]|nr:hypothetical protein [Candidatus Binataceae bacterium]